MTVTKLETIQSTSSGRVPAGFPSDSRLTSVAFLNASDASHVILAKLPAAFQKVAVAESAENAAGSSPRLEFLSVPTANHHAAELQERASNWVDLAAGIPNSPLQVMTLQGAAIFWNHQRVAILAPEDRLDTLRSVLIETCWYEAELTELEQTLAVAWPKLESDMPLAFSFNEKSLPRRPQLQEHFQQVVMLRSRLSRLAPHVYCPHLHPPTLASQVAERFRERTRLAHRHEILGDQLSTFEEIYEACGQRASDFVQSRKGHMLEWIIIVLLATQILLWVFELLTSAESTTTGL
jgi:hypothetical protein